MRKLIVLLVGVLMSFGTISLISSGAAHADTTTTQLPAACGQAAVVTSTTLDVTSCAYMEDSHHFDVSAATAVKVGGKQQLTWEHPNAKLGKLTLHKALKFKHVHITVDMSKHKVLKKYGNNACVDLTKGSTWTNHGKGGSKRVPFTTTVGHTRDKGEIMEVMCWNKHDKHWEHYASIVKVNGKKHLVVECRNWQTFKKVGAEESDYYIVRSPKDVVKSVSLTAVTGGHENVGGNFTCPNGSFTFNGGVVAAGSFSVTVTAKASELSAEVERAKTGALAKAQLNANLSYAGLAVISLHVSCGGSTPPPSQSPSVTAQAQSCVNAGDSNGVITGYVVNNDSAAHDATVSVDAKGVSSVKLSGIAANGGSAPFILSGLAPGTFYVTVSMPDINKSVTIPVTVNECSAPPVQHWTQISCMTPEEVTVGGSLKVSCVVSDDNGTPVSLSANSLDTNTKVSGIKCKDNGTASCPSGGTFEFTVVGVHEGTSQVQAIASANGVTATFTSDPFPVDPEDGGF